YPMNEGDVVSNRGLHIPVSRFEEEFHEVQVPHSNALHCVRNGGGSYLVGAMARYALNRDRLGPRARAMIAEVGLEPVVRNPFRSVVVRAVEMVQACDEALRIIDRYHEPDRSWDESEGPFTSANCAAITEAPRGLLYHRYRLNASGLIEEARIIPPTSQNQKRIEDDVRDVVNQSSDLDEARLTNECERAIRNHDPCISCATHFLTLDLVRS
ncbi:MAG: nickel-dependent hydrogenase large subunit, partial [Thermoplasmata archaeon]